jgi:hypothetical protein
MTRWCLTRVHWNQWCLVLTEIVAFEEQVLVNAQTPAELYKILHVVAGEEAAPRGVLPATTLYHRH